MVKRRNHEVPKGLLKGWLGHEDSKEGIHYIDLSAGTLQFEEGREANFAITDYIYVPSKINGERDDALEDWFAIDENGLAIFCQKAATGKLASFTNEKLINQAIRACIALGHRSAYGMFMAMSVLDPVNGSLHETAVANTVRSIGQKFKALSTWDFLVLCDLPVPLFISERPFLDFTSRGIDMVVMPLSPRSLLMGTPNNRPTESRMELRVGRAGPEHERIAKMHNNASVEMARQWLVAESRAELETVYGQLTPEKVLDRRRTDRVIVTGIER